MTQPSVIRLLHALSDLLLRAAIRVESWIPPEPPEPPQASYAPEESCGLAEVLAPQIHAGIVVITRSGLAVGARTHAMSLLAVMHAAQREGDTARAERMAERVIHLYTEVQGIDA